MSDVALLVAPSVMWHDEYGYELAEQELRSALALGCRAMLLHGGPLDETIALLARARATSPHDLLAAAELGGGLGERFGGATALPPLSAFDSADLDAIRRAARLTAREARAAGINCAVAPSCIVPSRAKPMQCARSFRGNDVTVGAACAEWLDACQAEGVVAAPGPYPFMRDATAEAALDAGVGALVLAHAHATDASLISYLRNEAGFEGVIVALLTAASEERGVDEDDLAVACIAAGCDLLLGVEEVAPVVRALRAATERGDIDPEQVRASCARVEERSTWAGVAREGRAVTLDDALWARRIADGAVHVQAGRAHSLRSAAEIVIIDDDPPRFVAAGSALRETLRKLDVDVHETLVPSPESRVPVVVALFGDRRIALGFDTFSDGAVALIREICHSASRSARDAVIIHFTPPEFGEALAGDAAVVCAWSGTRAMEEAAARWLVAART